MGGPTAMATTQTQQAPSAGLKAYEDKITAHMQEAKAKLQQIEAKAQLQQIEAKAKETKAQAEITTLNSLKAAKQNIDRKLQDLKTTNAAHVARAKADIDAD